MNGKDTSANNTRIAKNMLLLFARMFFLMSISIYVSRVVLKALGVEDYGVYNVLGGFVGMFSIMSGSLSAAISRFLNFELGKGDSDQLKRVFSSSVTIQIGLALILVFLLETIGLWFVNYKLVIPEGRLTTANWCYQFSILAFAIKLVSVPYNAAIVAHEKMSAFAFISILEGVGKLIIAWCISISTWDRLLLYSFLILLLSLTIRIIYATYCKRHFEECTYRFIYDRQLLVKMFSFAGWNFIGSSSGILRDHGVNVLLNLYFGPAVNSARGIAMQVSAAVTSFVQSFLTAIRPQITKNYSTNDLEYTFFLVFVGARGAFYLLLFMSLPIIVEAPMILSIWLEVVPEHTVLFVRLTLIYVMTESVSFTMTTLMLATGDIKKYQILVGGMQMLNFPISFLLLEMGFSPEWTIVNSIFVAIGCLVLRLIMLKQMIQFPALKFFIKVVLTVLAVSLLSAIFPVAVANLMDDGFLRLGIVCVISFISVLFTVLYLGCSKRERSFLMAKTVGWVKNRC